MVSTTGPITGKIVPDAEDLLFERLPLGLGLIDSGRRLVRCNSAFALTFEIALESRGAAFAPGLASGDDHRLRSALAEVLDNGVPFREVQIRTASRPEEYFTLVVARPPSGRPGARGMAMLAVRDVREQLQLEARVRQVTKMQAVGQLAGGVAHDFNNVLTAVLGLCDQLLERHTQGDSDFDDIDQIRINANRAAALVRQLLAFARQQTLQPRLLDIQCVLEPLRPLLQRLTGPEMRLEISYDAEAGRVRVDPGQLEQVVVNLVVNARDAMGGSGLLQIATRDIAAPDVAALGHDIMPAIAFIELAVEDSGAGIAPEIASRIFEPFFTTKPVGEGTGLGLASVYGIVKQSDGFIFMRPRPGGGSIFSVYLPVGEAQPDTIVEQSVQSFERAQQRTRVLLVEDERAVRLVVERSLQRDGFEVVSVADAGDALEVLRQREGGFDLLITDLVMPGIDGVQLIQTALGLYPELRTVLMSGYAEPPQRAAAGQNGMHFLAKPFSTSALVAIVRRAISQSTV